jgi:microcystin-dependent protein
LFQLIGTTYGGDGQATFALPDLRGRIPIHQGNGFILADTGGVEEVTLTISQIPNHGHALIGSEKIADVPTPEGNVVAKSTAVDMYIGGGDPQTPMSPQNITPIGGNQPHTNFQPYLCLNFIISLFGLFPPPQ